MAAAAAATARAVFCELQSSQNNFIIPKKESAADSSSIKRIVLQPRVCNLRSYGSDGPGVVRTRGSLVHHHEKDDGGDDVGVSSFFASLSEYIENSRKTQDFEIISGRFAMVVFAATVTAEIVTGNALFQKMDVQEITKVAGVCLAAVLCSACFAYFSSARTRVGRIFTVKCNAFIDSLIDNLIDGLFYETDLWTDDT